MTGPAPVGGASGAGPAPDPGDLLADGGDGEASTDHAAGPPVVVKVGGDAVLDPRAAFEDVAHLTAGGREVVVVHGGSTVVDETLERLGESPEYVETPDGVVGRFTDETAMAAFEMALPGRLNTELVADLQALGVRAVGLSGVDGGLLTGPRTSAVRVVEDGRRKIRRGDHSGSLRAVDGDLLATLLAGGYTPVVCPPMLADGETPVNVDADRVAAGVAAALDAALVVLTDVPGVLADPADPATVVGSATTPAELETLRDHAEGFMTRKLMAAEAALAGGATGVTVAAADRNDPLLAALAGDGTHLAPGALVEDDGDAAPQSVATGSEEASGTESEEAAGAAGEPAGSESEGTAGSEEASGTKTDDDAGEEGDPADGGVGA